MKIFTSAFLNLNRLIRLSLLTAAIASCAPKTAEKDLYTCPMHPTVIADKPGVCPVCNMDLVRKSRAGEDVKITEDLARLIKSPNEIVVSSIKTIRGEYKALPVTLKASGLVTYDSRLTYTISSRVGGRLEKVFLKYIFQPVNKGQKVAEIYSPELITSQRDLIYLLENDPENVGLIASARQKLIFSGLTDAQVNELIRQKKVSASFPVYSPYDGYLIAEQNEPAPASGENPSGMSGGMNSSAKSSTAPAATSRPLVQEGTYVTAGQALFRIVNASALRIEINLPASQAGSVHAGEKIELDFDNNEKLSATVDFVDPYFDGGENFLKIRVYTGKLNRLRVGQLVTAQISFTGPEKLWLPEEALLDLGKDQLVFVKEHTAFHPKKVVAGSHSTGWVEIREGLSTSDEVAANAHYLIDSESFVKHTN